MQLNIHIGNLASLVGMVIAAELWLSGVKLEYNRELHICLLIYECYKNLQFTISLIAHDFGPLKLLYFYIAVRDINGRHNI